MIRRNRTENRKPEPVETEPAQTGVQTETGLTELVSILVKKPLFKILVIPPALWATGGLGAPLPKESFFTEPLFPLGRGLPLPYPALGNPSRSFIVM